MKRCGIVLAVLALAFATMGQDGCDTSTTSEDTTSEQSQAERQEARERKREKRAERKREKRRQQQTTPRTEPPPPAPDCHPSYVGACLKPDASDYDCEGGSGDGPEYVSGPIRIVGEDPYDLDRDGDGTACE